MKKSALSVFIMITIFLTANGIRFFFFRPDEMFIDIEETYLLNMVYLPAIIGIAALVLLIIVFIVKRRISILLLPFFVISLSLFFLYAYTSIIEPSWLKIYKYEIRSDKINDRITIIHVSDIQSGRLGNYEEKVFKTIYDLSPDLIINTGDLIQPFNPGDYKSEMEKISLLFKQLTSKYKVYNVSGNIDSELELIRFDKLSGVKTLNNSVNNIKIKDTNMTLLGLSWPVSTNVNNEWIKDRAYRNNNFKIIFGHSPNYMLTATDHPIDLALAGHTHGGQIIIPFYGPLLTFSKVPKSLAKGYHKINNTHINVSSGVGAEHAAGIRSIRLFCRPSITVFTLIPEFYRE